MRDFSPSNFTKKDWIADPAPETLEYVRKWLDDAFPKADYCVVALYGGENSAIKGVVARHTYTVSTAGDSREPYFQVVISLYAFVTREAEDKEDTEIEITYFVNSGAFSSAHWFSMRLSDTPALLCLRLGILGVVSTLRMGIDSIWTEIGTQIGACKISEK